MLKNTLEEFKTFALKGNALDLAIGVIIGSAFGKIVSSLVDDIIMPPLGLILKGLDFSNLKILLKPASSTAEAVTVNYGVFVNRLIDFLIISVIIFLFIKFIANARKNEEAKIDKKPSEEAVILQKILEELKNSKT